MQRIVLASGNRGKVREIQAILANRHIEVVPQSDFNVPEAEENGLSFVENALIKARNAARITGLPAIADDSGLCVDALQGKPGIYSARYAGPQCDDQDNNALLLRELGGIPREQRGASFQCAIVYVRHADDPVPLIAQAGWKGFITESAEGENGFGYDPLFYVEAYQCTSAQLDPQQKNRISHRGQALQLFLKMFEG
ncbi:MAG: RdgB/HAM1 family non-canonical purine NTP pyrophosphatase [Gammaproteobacteria bacterium]|nr:RdgB/HAM1 family non-canonical purine NTP pyrophosphatase [Gammaproteobacteria bacterium]